MKKRKHKKLLLQTLLIICPLSLLMIAAVVISVYVSSVRSFLKAQQSQIEEMMTNLLVMPNDPASENCSDDLREWTIGEIMALPAGETMQLTPEESGRYREYLKKYTAIALNDQMPHDISVLFFKDFFEPIRDYFSQSVMRSSFGSWGIVDAQDPSRYRIILDLEDEAQKDQFGGYCDIDLSEHPVLQNALNGNGTEILFEKSDGLSVSGDYYIGYQPVVMQGKTRAVFVLTYKWDELHDSVKDTIIRSILIAVGFLTLIMALLLLFLKRGTIQPVTDISEALVDYSGNKDSKMIVKRMYDIKANNEIGYLADVVSDLALEIDAYTKENIRITKELYDAEVQIMMSQIRPHFMYNALTSIAMMCEIDPKTAKEATIHFSKYLRANMDSLKQTEPVPFERELEHLKNYLYIEKLRFDDLLNIEYDIQTTDFQVPLLSVQPLVENAVKHGVGMAEDGGTVKIATRETDTAYEVIISDDGVGFDPSAPAKEDGRSHIGMETTKKRLKELCGADVIITSRIGEGTVVRVVIPKNHQGGQKL